jgi:diguanylate cyclase (GGDEF)-like protein
MMGQGEALGVLHVRAPAASPADTAEFGAQVAEERRRTIVSVAEHIALALANLRLRDSLRTQAIRDPLTGLFNRRHMEESLERELIRGRRSRIPLAALMIDIDHFKRFNDAFGHAAADVALRDTATAIRDCLRPDDIACRYGGEELVVIMPDTPIERAVTVAWQIRAAIEAMQVIAQGVPLGAVTVSIGVAVSRGDVPGAEDLLRSADAALYNAKRTGRNRVCVAGEPADEAPASGATPPVRHALPLAGRTGSGSSPGGDGTALVPARAATGR